MSNSEVSEIILDVQKLEPSEQFEVLLLLMQEVFIWESSKRGDTYWAEVFAALAEEAGEKP